MAHLTGLRLVNWTRFRGEHEVALGPGVWALVARSKDDPRRSNWSGKSATLAAVRWLLFGSRVLDADVLDDLVSRGEQAMGVEAEFSDGTFVSRGRKRGSSSRDLVYSRDGRESAGDGAQERIDAWLGLSEEDLLSTAWSEQGEMGLLVARKSTALTATVRGWAGLERLEKAGDLAEGVFAEAAKELSAAREDLARLEEAGGDERVAALRAELNVAEAGVIAEKKAHVAAALEFQNWKERVRLADFVRQREEAEAELAGLRKSIFTETQPAEVDRLEGRCQLAVSDARNADAEQARLARLVKEGFDGGCPVSPGFVCPAREQVDARTEENRKAAVEAGKIAGKKRAAYDVAHGELNKVRRAESERVVHRAKVERAEARLKMVVEQVAIAYRQGVLRPPAEGEVAPVPPPPLDSSVAAAASRALVGALAANSALSGARARAELAERALRVARAAARVLGPEGALRRASEGAVALVRSEACRVLAEGGVPLRVSAEWSRETGSPAEHCAACGLAFPKSARVKQCPGCGAPRGMKQKHEFRFRTSSRSGAARDLGGLAVRCGAARYLASTRACGLSLGLFDEPLSQLDAAHREVVARHLGRMLGSSFEQVIVADHHAGFMDALPRAIVVVADGEWSRLEVRG